MSDSVPHDDEDEELRKAFEKIQATKLTSVTAVPARTAILAMVAQFEALPEPAQLQKPGADSPIDEWLDYQRACQEQGISYSIADLVTDMMGVMGDDKFEAALKTWGDVTTNSMQAHLDSLGANLNRVGEGLYRLESGKLNRFNANVNRASDGLAALRGAAVTPKIWEMIPDVGCDRLLVELWHTGLNGAEIAPKVGRATKAVYNRISELRGKYKATLPDLLPYRKT